MTDYQVRAMQLSGQILKTIFRDFDEHEVFKGLRLLERYNFTRRTAFPGEKLVTPGMLLDDYIETRTFEARL